MRSLSSALCLVSLLFTTSLYALPMPPESEHRRASEEAAAEAGRQNRAATNEMAGKYAVPFNAAHFMAEVEWCEEHGPANIRPQASKLKANLKKDSAFVKIANSPVYAKLKPKAKAAVAKVFAKPKYQGKNMCGMVSAALADPAKFHKIFITPEEMEAADAQAKK